MVDKLLEDNIDFESALKRVGGNRRLLETLMKKFANDSYFEQLKREIAAKDFAAAAKTAHGIKGVTANLSLNELCSVVTQLEQQLKNGIYEEKTLIEAEKTYQAVVLAINQSLP